SLESPNLRNEQRNLDRRKRPRLGRMGNDGEGLLRQHRPQNYASLEPNSSAWRWQAQASVCRRERGWRYPFRLDRRHGLGQRWRGGMAALRQGRKCYFGKRTGRWRARVEFGDRVYQI